MGNDSPSVCSKGPSTTRWHRSVRSRLTMSAVVVVLVVVGTSVGSGVAGALVPWKIVASPNNSGENNILAAVSCNGSAECVAVGHSAGNNVQTLIESWNGSGWSIVPSPDTSPTADNLLWGVSCSGPTDCTAVGSVEVGTDYQTLIESWTGTTWSIVPSPSTSPTENSLLGVSCYDLTHCMAVGSAQVGTNGRQTLTESWNGTVWSIEPNPASTSTYEQLSGVSCTSPTDCTAVGYDNTNSGAETLVESWNGSAWSIVTSPNPTSIPGLYGDGLDTVSCTSPTACVAVGGNNTISTHFVQTLIESWDGTSWSVVPSPNGPGTASSLGGVSCINPSSCNAVGSSGGGIGSSTLIESWDGSTWSVVPSPNRGNPPADDLGGVSCVSPTACTAVGSSGNRTSKTLVESMNGIPPKFSGPAPGQVTCAIAAKISFSPPLTDAGGGTAMTVKGGLTNCTPTTPGLSIASGKLTSAFPGPGTGCAALGAGDVPATIAIDWKGQYNPPDDSFAGKASFADSTVTVTGAQEVTDGMGDVGFVAPGAGNDADTSGSFAAAGPNGAAVIVSSGQTASQLSTLCSPTPRANKPPKPAKGIKSLTLTGSVTIG
jgi:hypothetical protein